MEWPLADKMCVDRPVCLRGGGLGRARESRRRCRRRRRLRQVSRGRGRAGAEKAGAARDNGERPLGGGGEGGHRGEESSGLVWERGGGA